MEPPPVWEHKNYGTFVHENVETSI